MYTDNHQANYKKDGVPNCLCIQPRVLADVAQNFQQSLVEITLEVTQQKVLIRNYIDDNSSKSLHIFCIFSYYSTTSE